MPSPAVPRRALAGSAPLWRYAGAIGKAWRTLAAAASPETQAAHRTLLLAIRAELMPHMPGGHDEAALLGFLTALAGRPAPAAAATATPSPPAPTTPAATTTSAAPSTPPAVAAPKRLAPVTGAALGAEPVTSNLTDKKQGHATEATGKDLAQVCTRPPSTAPLELDVVSELTRGRVAEDEEQCDAEATDNADRMMRVTCPQGHRLLSDTAEVDYACDGCECDLTAGANLLVCYACDFCLCPRCLIDACNDLDSCDSGREDSGGVESSRKGTASGSEESSDDAGV